MRYRKKPVEIEAEQWFPERKVDGVEFPVMNSASAPAGIHHNQGIIHTLEGNHVVTSGDWVITGVKGEKYACKPDIFEMTYDPVERGAGEKSDE